MINPLWQALQDARDQQHMAIFNRTDIDGNNTGGTLNINWSIGEELSFTVLACFEPKEHLFLTNFGEVEF